MSIEQLEARVSFLEKIIKEHCTIDVDISASKRDLNTVIIMGRYRNHDYVRVFEFQADEFSEVVKVLHDLERQHARFRYKDIPLEVRGPIRRPGIF